MVIDYIVDIKMMKLTIHGVIVTYIVNSSKITNSFYLDLFILEEKQDR